MNETTKEVAAEKAEPTIQETVKRLQQQFASTGTVQASDLNRVFGSPVAGVEVALRRECTTSTWKFV